ncbi:MAG: hypothetical protein ACLP05_13220 [Candidatus Kryptoniota bacterium]
MSSELLRANIEALRKQANWLERSFNQCSAIGIKTEYSSAEFDSFETLSGRFARSIDFLVRKTLRSLDDVEFESQGTLVDVVNNAHKRGLFKDINDMTAMRDLRNDLVHEYLDEDLKSSFGELLELTPKLLDIMSDTIRYSAKYLKGMAEQ